MHVPQVWCDRKSSFCIVPKFAFWGTLSLLGIAAAALLLLLQPLPTANVQPLKKNPQLQHWWCTGVWWGSWLASGVAWLDAVFPLSKSTLWTLGALWKVHCRKSRNHGQSGVLSCATFYASSYVPTVSLFAGDVRYLEKTAWFWTISWKKNSVLLDDLRHRWRDSVES